MKHKTATGLWFRFQSFIYNSILTILFFSVLQTPTYAASVIPDQENKSIGHALSFTGRMHREHSAIESMPYGDSDLGWLLAYELHEGIGFWQAGVEFSDSPSKNQLIDYVLTPQLNLILKDRIYRAGLGIRWNYLKSGDPDTEESTWSDLLWQFTIGLSYPVWNRLELGAYSYYVFEEWSELGEFDFEDIEFGIAISYRFY